MPTPPSLLADLAASVGASHADRAVDAAMRALQLGVSSSEILRAAAHGAATHYEPAFGRPPWGLVALASAANLSAILPRHAQPLPVLQAVVLAASEKKADAPARSPSVVRGEITHLGRSFLLASRDGNLPEAEAIFLGIVDERSERRMAGDMLFRAAAEDMGHGGLKLVAAVKLWQLARAFRFRDARTILRPAIQFLVASERDASAFREATAVLGREWVDLEGLATGGNPLDEAGRDRLPSVLHAADAPSCVAATLSLLTEGYSATGVAEAFSREASRRLLGARGFDRGSIGGLLFAHAARFVLTFTRSAERLHALFQAAMRLRSPSPRLDLPPAADMPSEDEELRCLAGDLEARRPEAAASRAASYLRRGASSSRLLGLLADHASRDSAIPSDGLNLALADACTAEFLATKAPEPAMALAKAVASAPADWTAYRAWEPLLRGDVTSS